MAGGGVVLIGTTLVLLLSGLLVKLRYSETERKQNSTQSEKVNENQCELRFIIAKPIDFFMCLRYYGTMEVVPMIDRPLYVDKIMAYTDTPFVKVLTGVRRCGKSTILKMIMEKLQQKHGIPSERIVSMRFDSMDYEDMTAKDVFKTVKEKLNPTGRTYLFLDEVYTIVQDIYNSTIFSDIVKRNQIRKIDQLEIRDNYPKYVLRTDEFAGGNYQGIKSMHIADFLLSTEY